MKRYVIRGITTGDYYSQSTAGKVTRYKNSATVFNENNVHEALKLLRMKKAKVTFEELPSK